MPKEKSLDGLNAFYEINSPNALVILQTQTMIITTFSSSSSCTSSPQLLVTRQPGKESKSEKLNQRDKKERKTWLLVKWKPLLSGHSTLGAEVGA
jgi:hypothetical protein